MSFQSEKHKAEIEQYRQTKAYYASIRKPRMELLTFAIAFAASIAVAGRIFGWWLIGYGQWTLLFYIVSFIAFVGSDSILAKAHHPVPLPLDGFNPSRMFEKFAMQGRAWQLLVILMLPVTARFIVAIIAFTSTH